MEKIKNISLNKIISRSSISSCTLSCYVMKKGTLILLWLLLIDCFKKDHQKQNLLQDQKQNLLKDQKLDKETNLLFNYTFGVHVWTWNRLASLQRLIHSLQVAAEEVASYSQGRMTEEASYSQGRMAEATKTHGTDGTDGTDGRNLSVDLIFHVDGNYDPEIPLWIYTHFSNCNQHRNAADSFEEEHKSNDRNELSWLLGNVLVDLGEEHVGLPEAILKTPTKYDTFWAHDYCILLEDDLAVSPFLWDWIQFVLPFLPSHNYNSHSHLFLLYYNIS